MELVPLLVPLIIAGAASLTISVAGGSAHDVAPARPQPLMPGVRCLRSSWCTPMVPGCR